jgi:hypothetical protein
VFSEFAVFNPESRAATGSSIRGAQAGDNHCSCPDFATNDLGTCKHIEFTLAQISADRAARARSSAASADRSANCFSTMPASGASACVSAAISRRTAAEADRLFDRQRLATVTPQHFADLPAFVDRGSRRRPRPALR